MGMYVDMLWDTFPFGSDVDCGKRSFMPYVEIVSIAKFGTFLGQCRNLSLELKLMLESLGMGACITDAVFV